MKANHFVYRVSWSASVAMSWADFSGIPPSYLRRFKIDSLISRGAGGGQFVVTFSPSVFAVYPTPEDAKASPEEFEHLKQAAAARIDEFLDAWILPKYKNAVKIDAAPKFHVVATVADVFRRLRDSEDAYGEDRRALSEALRARYPFALVDLDYYTHCKIIAVGTAAEICDALDDQMKPATGIDDVIYKYLIIDSDGETVHKIPGEFYGVICADATASASLYTLDEDGEPDSLIWETVHSGSLYRCHRSTRFPLVVEWAGFDLFDDMAITCRREWEEYAAANGYTHAGGDTWEKAGSKFVLIEDERTPENCSACVCDIF